MKNAKRMVLVDEKVLHYKPMLQHYQTKQDLTWKRPIPEDVKAKHYGQNLRRFMHTKRKLAEEPLVDLMPTVDELLDIKRRRLKRKRGKEKED
jgi:hypothetical protein